MTQKMTMKSDVFLIYRMEGGAEVAYTLTALLMSMGYSICAGPVQTDRSAPKSYAQLLVQNIVESSDVVVVLTPGCLDACTDSNDKVRYEVKCATAAGKNIVSVLMPGFVFPPTNRMHDDLSALLSGKGLIVSQAPLTKKDADALVKLLSKRVRRPMAIGRMLYIAYLLILSAIMLVGYYLYFHYFQTIFKMMP